MSSATCTASRRSVTVARLIQRLPASLSACLSVALATDCVWVEAGSSGNINIRRPVYAGKAYSYLVLSGSGPHILSLRPNIFRGPGPDTSRSGEVEVIDVRIPVDELVLKIKEVVRETGEGLDITEARVVVSGGLGMQEAENFKFLKD